MSRAEDRYGLPARAVLFVYAGVAVSVALGWIGCGRGSHPVAEPNPTAARYLAVVSSVDIRTWSALPPYPLSAR